MKKVMFSGVMALLVGTSAAVADDSTTLTTKNYVDSGLRAVYQKAQTAESAASTASETATAASDKVDALESVIGDSTDGLVKDVADLQGVVGDSTDGLVKDVADLQDTVGNTALTTTADTVTGAINELKTTIDTLDNLGTDGLGNNKTYVLKTNASGEGSWSELEVVNTWDPSVLTPQP